MKKQRDKSVIDHWLRLYNWLTDASFAVVDWPDSDSSKKNIDAMCRDRNGHTRPIEHTLIEPFDGEKADADRFAKTLASLENHQSFLQRGYMFLVSQPVGSIPNGIEWRNIPQELLRQLPNILPTLPEGARDLVIRSERLELPLRINKMRLLPQDTGKFLTGRVGPGNRGPELIIRALEKKIPKLSAAHANRKGLLLEKDAVSGTIENQFEQIPENHEIRKLMVGIDEIWSANTAGLERENMIYTNLVMPRFDRATICSLNVQTGEFWRVPVQLVG
jgi:hypothetical protein